MDLESYSYNGTPVSFLKTECIEKWHNQFAHFGMFPRLRRDLAAAFALHEQAKSGDGFDVVEVTDWGFLYLPWVINTQTRVLVQLHGSNGQLAHYEPIRGREAEGSLQLLLDKVGLGAATNLSSQSRANARWWETLLSRHVEYQLPLIKLESMVADAKVAGDKWLSVGRIQHWKGPQVACAAWRQLGHQAPLLEWVGGDYYHGETGQSAAVWLEQQFPDVWGGKIQPLGRIPSDQWLQRMLAAKAVLVPSLWDVLNRVTIEAMAFGKVVVVSDGAGVVELVEHGVNGFIFPKADATALAKLVRHVESLNANELHSIGQNAAAIVREKLDTTCIVSEKLRLYRSLPEPAINQAIWLRECLLTTYQANSLSFLDALSLRELVRYVGQRCVKKIFRRANSSFGLPGF